MIQEAKDGNSRSESGPALSISRTGLMLLVAAVLVGVLFMAAIFFMNAVSARVVELQQQLATDEAKLASLQERLTELETHPELPLLRSLIDMLINHNHAQ